jgi:hypothetical protein
MLSNSNSNSINETINPSTSWTHPTSTMICHPHALSYEGKIAKICF